MRFTADATGRLIENKAFSRWGETKMNTFGCVNNTIRCHSGTYFDLTNPIPEKVDIEDIAKGLSNLCRFGGQIDQFYSVAEHSVNCAEVAIADGQSREVVFAVLMHDAAESYVGDVVKPLKLMLPEFSAIERKVEQAIAESFEIKFDAHADVIKEIDHAVLIAERRRLFTPDKETWTGENEVRSLDIGIRCLRPASAYHEFFKMYSRFGVNRN